MPVAGQLRTFDTLDDLVALAGQEVALSDWVAVSQPRIQQFADATGDHQWIHVDEARAREGPFGAPIAHGFLTLSLIPWFFDTSVRIADMRMSVNYGLNRVRFTAPVPAGSRVRGRLTFQSAEPMAGDGVQAVWLVTVEREASDKPACVAELVVRYHR